MMTVDEVLALLAAFVFAVVVSYLVGLIHGAVFAGDFVRLVVRILRAPKRR